MLPQLGVTGCFEISKFSKIAKRAPSAS